MLDPVARHDFMATVLAAAAADGVSVLLSSHVLAELERVAGYLILLSRGRVQLAGEVADLLAAHRLASLEELALAYLRETRAGGDAMTALTVPARPERRRAARGRCRGGGWPGSPGGSTASRWPEWPCSSARWRCACGSPAIAHHVYAAMVACHPVASVACGGMSTSFMARKLSADGDQGSSCRRCPR